MSDGSDGSQQQVNTWPCSREGCDWTTTLDDKRGMRHHNKTQHARRHAHHHRCSECAYTSVRLDSVRTHEFKHHNINTEWVCHQPNCKRYGEGLLSEKALRNHLQGVHRGATMEENANPAQRQGVEPDDAEQPDGAAAPVIAPIQQQVVRQQQPAAVAAAAAPAAPVVEDAGDVEQQMNRVVGDLYTIDMKILDMRVNSPEEFEQSRELLSAKIARIAIMVGFVQGRIDQ
ncbi:uncharacterized protein PG986_001116 [Apiospora aurea]|uniref:C2H2-type domain-containing protein n=1 Tax=Apiospora aurea TaxID=335848 RepID=A0ABR1QW46_9PEZI